MNATSRRFAAIAAGLALLAGGCAGTDEPVAIQTSTTTAAGSDVPTSETVATPSPETPTTAAPATTQPRTAATPTTETRVTVNLFPDRSVVDVESGQTLTMQDLSTAGTPVAVWFYYPH